VPLLVRAAEFEPSSGAVFVCVGQLVRTHTIQVLRKVRRNDSHGLEVLSKMLIKTRVRVKG